MNFSEQALRHEVADVSLPANAPEMTGSAIINIRSTGDTVPLGDLELAAGFGLTIPGFSGTSAVGDLNGDGFTDFAISILEERSHSLVVIYGGDRTNLASLSLDDIDGSNAFVITEETTIDYIGWEIAPAGDVNGDGFDDFSFGSAEGIVSYVLFGGTAPIDANLDPSSLDGSNGFAILQEAAQDTGLELACAGDINGDGIDDMLIGGWGYNNYDGRVYVLYGRDSTSGGSFDATLDLANLDAADGFFIDAETPTAALGIRLSSVGDINDDGIDDFVVYGNPNEMYVIFGRDDADPFGASFDLSTLDGSNGFKILAKPNGPFSVRFNPAGDVNGDGIDDMLVTGHSNAGFDDEAYVIFGRNTATDGDFGASFNLADLDGSNGFAITNYSQYDRFGSWASSAGDINGDGIGDIMVGATFADPDDITDAGTVHIIFGRDTVTTGDFSATLNVAELNGLDGFVITGETANGYLGDIKPIGDVDGDGLDDILMAAVGSESFYILFGQSADPTAQTLAERDPGRTGRLTAEGGVSFTAETLTGTYGTLTIGADGAWSYTLGTGTQPVETIAGGATAGDAFAVRTVDDEEVALNFTILGYDNPVTFSGTLNGTVTESEATSVSGLASAEDVDGDSFFLAETVEGQYGSLVMQAGGTWTYTLDGDTYDFTAMTADDTLSDTVTVHAADGTEQAINITIQGHDADPAVTGVPTEATRVLEDTAATLDLSGMNISDIDSATVTLEISLDGTFGGLAAAGSDTVTVETLSGSMFSITGSVEHVNAYLANASNIVFTPLANISGDTAYNFTMTVTSDGGGRAHLPNILGFLIVPVNDTPSSPQLTSDGVAENEAGAFVGTLMATDVDGDAVSFSVSDERFRVEGNELWLADGVALDFEATPELSVRVVATDSIGATSVRFATVHVLDRDESIALPGTGGSDTLRGSDGNDTLTGGMGSDTLVGGAGNDTLFAGSAGEDDSDSAPNHLWAGGGNDEATGSGGDDLIGGSDGDDMLNGMGGDDTLYGAEGSDTLTGGAGDDLLYNGAGDDSAAGGAGDDTLWGGAGNDILSGGDGGDSFVFANGHGTDVITDFNVDEDTLDLSLIAGIDDFSDLAAEDATSGGETGVLLHTSENSSIFLAGVTLSAIEAATTIN